MNTTTPSPIPLIIGAGPTGMMASLWLLKYSIPHRIVDAAPSTGTNSRAIVVHAKTLELYRQLDLAEAVVAQSTILTDLAIYHNNAAKGKISLENSGRGLSKYPFVLSVTQDDHEALLERTIIQRGGKVQRNVKVKNVQEAGECVKVTMAVDGTEEEFTASYVIGCDGSHSVVRHSLNIPMEGGTYDRAFFVADVYATGKLTNPTQFNVCLSNEDFTIVAAMPHNRFRLVGFVPKSIENTNPESVTFEDVKPTLKRNIGDMNITHVNWFSRYKIHHRTAARFQQNRIFLCGDAAHIHSPVGGQGMNTGLGDATNIAWKLAAVFKGGSPALLDTYAPERMRFAKKLVTTTDTAFTTLTGEGYLSSCFRNWVVPYVFPALIRFVSLGPFMFGNASQLKIEYCKGPMSMNLGDEAGSNASIRAGNRLPWVENLDGQEKDNHILLVNGQWQAHVYGKAPSWVKDKLEASNVPLHQFDWNETMKKVGLRPNVTYLVRPDGYIGVVLGASAKQDSCRSQLDEYVERWGVGKLH